MYHIGADPTHPLLPRQDLLMRAANAGETFPLLAVAPACAPVCAGTNDFLVLDAHPDFAAFPAVGFSLPFGRG